MGEWRPMEGLTIGRQGRPAPLTVKLVRKKSAPVFRLPPVVIEPFGDAHFVEPLRNGDRDRVGLRATTPSPRRVALRLSRTYASRARCTQSLSATGILKAAGKLLPHGEFDIPHSWDGDVLVLDLSGLPDLGVR